MPKRISWEPRTRQKEGDQTEKKIVKERGGRAHPRSGAGTIKWDGSSEDELLEIKDANKSHVLGVALLDKLLRDASKQGKAAVYIVQFKHLRIRAVCHLERY